MWSRCVGETTRVLVIADIHGNLPALEAVLADPYDMLICLGDMAGYSTDLIVRGNHEQALVTGAASGCSSGL